MDSPRRHSGSGLVRGRSIFSGCGNDFFLLSSESVEEREWVFKECGNGQKWT